MFTGLALPLTLGDAGSAHAFCPPGKSGLNATSPANGGNFPAWGAVTFDPSVGFTGPWNATSAGSGASGGVSQVVPTCETAPAGPHAD